MNANSLRISQSKRKKLSLAGGPDFRECVRIIPSRVTPPPGYGGKSDSNRNPMADGGGEVRLASMIIRQALSDFMQAAGKDRDELHEFLTGQTDIGRFWFNQADLEPLHGTPDKIAEIISKSSKKLCFGH